MYADLQLGKDQPDIESKANIFLIKAKSHLQGCQLVD
jgi:hypothetical protein